MIAALRIPVDADWRLAGNCSDLGDDTMFPNPRDAAGIAAAKAVCAGCPVATECLAYADEQRERAGIWGGKTVAERGLSELHGSKPGEVRACGQCGVEFRTVRPDRLMCNTCHLTQPPTPAATRLLRHVDAITAMKRAGRTDADVAFHLGGTADDVVVARRILGVDSSGRPRRVEAVA
jgi:WhiB family redox-sensing transcriptional regulator